MKDRTFASVARITPLPALATAVLAAAALLGLVACGGNSVTLAPTASSLPPTVSATPTTSATPSTHPSPTSSKQSLIAVAGGSQANELDLVGPSGDALGNLGGAGSGPISHIAWSSDGRWIAFLQSKSGSNAVRLWAYDMKTAKLKEVGAGTPSYSTGSFAWVGPDQLIESYVPAGKSTYHVNGSLYLCDVAKGTGNPVMDLGSAARKGSGVSASADGVKVAFVTYGATSGANISESLVVLDAKTLGVTTVAKALAPTDVDGDSFTYPLISTDGSLIYTLQTGSDIGFGTTVFALDGSKALVNSALIWPSPGSWSAGGRLAFGGGSASSTKETDSIQVWQKGLTKPTAILPPVKRPITSLCWSPDGTRIAYSEAHASGVQGTLWLVGADGSGASELLANGSWPAWSPVPVSFP